MCSWVPQANCLDEQKSPLAHNFYQNGLPGEAKCSRPPQVYNSPSSTRKNNPTMSSAHGSVIRGSLGVSELSGLLAEDAMDLLGRAGAADRVGELQRI